jgi:hypothetical protein
MGEQFKRGDKVMWQADGQTKAGQVIDTYLQNSANLTSPISTYSTASKNALLIELTDGSKVLKLAEEVRRS